MYAMITTYEVWKVYLCTGMEEFAFIIRSSSREEVIDVCIGSCTKDYVYFIKYPGKAA